MTGTNFDIKSHSTSMQQTMDMDTSTKTINTESCLKASKIGEIIYYNFQHKNKVWSKSHSSSSSTILGELLIVSNSIAHNLLSTYQIAKQSFK